MSDGKFEEVAAPTVLSGAFIPAHDMTFDIAEAIGRMLDRFQKYVTEARDAEQADNATEELLTAFLNEAQKRDASPE
jgi:DNA-binding ferritin-like protein